MERVHDGLRGLVDYEPDDVRGELEGWASRLITSRLEPAALYLCCRHDVGRLETAALNAAAAAMGHHKARLL